MDRYTMLKETPVPSDLTVADRLAMADFLDLAEELYGAERGTNAAADLITQSADGADLNRMWAEFQRIIEIHNRERQPLVNLLTYRVSALVEQIRYPVEEDFEEATEFGEPKGIRLGPPFNLGFNFKWWDIAIRYTWLFLAESTQAQIEALTNSALEADNRLMFTRILRQIFNPTTDVATINGQAVNVYPFFNADGMVPPKYKTTVHSGSHTHYLTSGAGTVDAGDMADLETHLSHHGYTIQRGYKLVIVVNQQEADVIRTFKVGVAGAKYDFLPSGGIGGGVILPPGTIIGRPADSVPGLLTIGTYGPFAIAQEDYMPAGYILAFATGGVDNLSNPVGIREHDNTALRGLRLVKGREKDYPLVDSFYQHGFGTGVRHRGGGVVMQVTAGSYTIPTAYL